MIIDNIFLDVKVEQQGKNMKHCLKKSFIALAIINTINLSYSASTTSVLQASGKISDVCYLTATNINFGILNLKAPGNINYANGTLSLLCTKSTSYSVILGFGTAATGAFYTNGRPNTGFMTGQNTGNHIAYSIQSQPINNSLPSWGSTPVNGTGTGSNQNYSMYGEIQLNAFGTPAYPVPDNYSDNVTATVTF